MATAEDKEKKQEEGTLKSEVLPRDVSGGSPRDAPRGEEKTLLAWKAPSRPFKRRNREFFTTVFAIAFLLGVILLFIKEWLLIAVIVALVFVFYVFSTISPEEVEHKITTRGVRTGGRIYEWDELGRFWFASRWGQKMLAVETRFRMPGQLLLLLGDQKEDKIKEALGKHLSIEEPEPGFFDRAADWLTAKIPLEEEGK